MSSKLHPYLKSKLSVISLRPPRRARSACAFAFFLGGGGFGISVPKKATICCKWCQKKRRCAADGSGKRVFIYLTLIFSDLEHVANLMVLNVLMHWKGFQLETWVKINKNVGTVMDRKKNSCWTIPTFIFNIKPHKYTIQTTNLFMPNKTSPSETAKKHTHPMTSWFSAPSSITCPGPS